MSEIVIAGAARTPVGSFNGAFATLAAHDLGQVAISEAMRRANVEGGDVTEVIMGQVLAAATGLQIANYNAPDQFVLGGDRQAIDAGVVWGEARAAHHRPRIPSHPCRRQ